MMTARFDYKMWYGIQKSRLSGLSRKSKRLMMRIPFSLCHGAMLSLTMITFLKLSDILISEADSWAILSLSGMDRADWI